MKTKRKTRLLALALAGVMGAGCDSATEPEPGTMFDAAAALEDYRALDSLLTSQGMDGLGAMAAAVSLQGLGSSAQGTIAIAEGLALPADEEQARAFAVRMVGAAAQLTGGPALSPVISPLHRGKTFVYDPELGRYAVDPDRTDAPANGVRFEIYAPGDDGKPNPDEVIGFADLIDEGDDSVEDIALRLVISNTERTVLDYRTTLDALDDGGRITVDGFVRGEYDELTFAIAVEGTEGADGAELDVGFTMAVPTRAFEIVGSVTGMESDSGEGGTVDLTVTHGSESFRVDITGTESSIDGTFYLNGELFATVSGDPDDPTFLGASGEPLTQLEVLMLHRIVDVVEDVFDLFEDLLDPIDEIVLLAIIL